MGRVGENLDIDFVISTGDNFYDNGLTGVDDKAFEDSFSNIYTANSLQKQWYADCKSGKSVQVINPKDKSKLKEASSWISCIAVDTSESWLGYIHRHSGGHTRYNGISFNWRESRMPA